MERLEQLIQMYNEDPSDSFIRFALAKEYEKQGKLDKALKYYTELVKDHPEYTGTYYHLAKLYEQIEEFEKAKETYEKGIKMAEDEGDDLSSRELKEAYLILQAEML
jgi:Tfp pilus assembly protein PilF